MAFISEHWFLNKVKKGVCSSIQRYFPLVQSEWKVQLKIRHHSVSFSYCLQIPHTVLFHILIKALLALAAPSSLLTLSCLSSADHKGEVQIGENMLCVEELTLWPFYFSLCYCFPMKFLLFQCQELIFPPIS